MSLHCSFYDVHKWSMCIFQHSFIKVQHLISHAFCMYLQICKWSPLSFSYRQWYRIKCLTTISAEETLSMCSLCQSMWCTYPIMTDFKLLMRRHCILEKIRVQSVPASQCNPGPTFYMFQANRQKIKLYCKAQKGKTSISQTSNMNSPGEK